ncbi:hypothetical protein HNQ94_001110 [Salirhabdus euzebyi]|uniref:DUF4367 domain-containing protein n=1 Tax=Salirhabdus euzebyi TaxID=394506 RepID=A0A841PXC6_9BACI|nr:hypothetical protein [Salirhabdus euzebyi]MBB6452664.1 hypothetical protein [Salirhabdus euzebyi]
MKKLIIFSFLVLFLLVACEYKTARTLDTSKLTEKESETTGEFELPFDIYTAPSLEVALDAVPFEVNLPEELPFDAQPLKVLYIYDFEKDGKKIEVGFSTLSNNTHTTNFSKNHALLISARNYETHHLAGETPGTEVTIKDDIKGKYYESQLSFSVEGIYYSLQMLSNAEDLKDELLSVAKQMI